MSTPRLAATLGVSCALSLGVGNVVFGGAVPEWVAQLVWLAVVLGGAAVCGYRSPEQAWRWGAIIVGVQPPTVFVLFLVVGELTHPTSSTGGLAAMFIFTFFMAFIFPIAVLASYMGSWARLHRRAGPGVGS